MKMVRGTMDGKDIKETIWMEMVKGSKVGMV